MKKQRLPLESGKRAVAILFLLSIFTPFTSFSQVDLAWESTMGSNLSVSSYDVEDGPNSSTYVLGSFSGTTFADQDDTTSLSLTPPNNEEPNLFLKMLDKNGKAQWLIPIQCKTDRDNPTKTSKLAVDDEGSVYLFLLFDDSIGVGFGPSTKWIVSSKTTQTLCGLKFNNKGEYEWHYMVDDMDFHQFNFVRTDGKHNVYMAANYSGKALTFTPGKNEGVVEESRPGFFVLQLKPDGSFDNVISFAGDKLTGFDVDANGNKAFTGNFTGFFDFDPGPKLDSLHTIGRADLFFFKLDASNNVIWKRIFGGPSDDRGGDLIFDHDGSIVTTFDFSSALKTDDEGKTLTSERFVGASAIVLRFHPNGRIHWVKNFSAYDGLDDLELNKGVRGIYVAQEYMHSINIGTNERPFILYPYTQTHERGYLIGLLDRNDGSFSSYIDVKHRYTTTIRSYEIQDTGVVLCLSFVDSFVTQHHPPIRLSQRIGDPRTFVSSTIRINGSACVNAYPQIKSVSNVSCLSQGSIELSSFDKSPLRITVPELDTVYTNASKITIPQKGYYSLLCSDSTGCASKFGVFVNGPRVEQKNCDFNVYGSSLRPGRLGKATMSGGPFDCKKQDFTVMLLLNPAIEYVDCDITPDKISGDTLLWDFKEAVHYPKMPRIAVKPHRSLGDTFIYSKLIFGPTDSFYSGDKTGKDVIFDVINSRDPNDLQASPKGACDEGLVEKSQSIEYTIRFQNTGSASAIDIRLLDTLSPYFDHSSLEVLTVSHETDRVVINKDGVLEVFFKGINLPSINQDSVFSSGFIRFKLKPAKHIEMGSVIENQAYIYFDFNAPVATNKTHHTIHADVSNWQMTVDTTVCNSIRYNDRVFDNSGSYTVYKKQIGGCDSTIFLNLDVVKNKAQFAEVDGGFEALDPNASHKWFDCKNSWKLVSTSQNFKPNAVGQYALVQTKASCTDTSTCVMFGTESTGPGLTNSKNYTVYPNPGDGHYVLQFGEEVFTGQIELTDAKGGLIQVEMLDGISSHSITTPEANGVYFIRLIETDGVTVHRIIKK